MAALSKLGVQVTAVITGAYLSGAMMGISLIAVPVMLDTNKEVLQLLQQWVCLYHYGHMIMPTMAVGTFLLHGYTAVRQCASGNSWLTHVIAGVATIGIVPFTWIFMIPTNNTLFALRNASAVAGPGAAGVASLGQVQEIVIKWTWLHVVRSLFPLAGASIGLMNLLQKD